CDRSPSGGSLGAAPDLPVTAPPRRLCRRVRALRVVDVAARGGPALPRHEAGDAARLAGALGDALEVVADVEPGERLEQLVLTEHELGTEIVGELVDVGPRERLEDEEPSRAEGSRHAAEEASLEEVEVDDHGVLVSREGDLALEVDNPGADAQAQAVRGLGETLDQDVGDVDGVDVEA